jgi:hypothetical protein
MDCREFCDQHVAFVDDTLAGIELVRMQPSADFSQRLEARLRNCEYDHLFVTTQRNLRRGAIAATVASVLMLGYIGSTLFHSDAPRDLVMAPVVATIPEPDLTPFTTSTPAIVTSVSAGLTIWPAALFAEQVPVRFAHSSLELANYTR